MHKHEENTRTFTNLNSWHHLSLVSNTHCTYKPKR